MKSNVVSSWDWSGEQETTGDGGKISAPAVQLVRYGQPVWDKKSSY